MSFLSTIKAELSNITSVKERCTLAATTDDKSIILAFLDEENEHVRAAATENFIRRAHSRWLEEGEFWADFAANPGTPARVLECFSFSYQPEIKKQMAGNPNTPEHVLLKYLNGTDYTTLRFKRRTPVNLNDILVRNPAATPKVLKKLAAKKGGRVFKRVLVHPNVTPEVWDTAMKEQDDIGLSIISNHKDTPPQHLVTLLRHEHVVIRSNAKSHPNLPYKNLLSLLASFENMSIALRNPSLTSETLTKFANEKIRPCGEKDKDLFYSTHDVITHPNTPDELILSFLENPPKSFKSTQAKKLLMMWVLNMSKRPTPTILAEATIRLNEQLLHECDEEIFKKAVQLIHLNDDLYPGWPYEWVEEQYRNSTSPVSNVM